MQQKVSTLTGILIIAVAVIVFGGLFAYQNYQSQKLDSHPLVENTNQAMDFGAYIPSKVYADTYTSGHVAIFKADHTLPSAWGLDYAGPNDTRVHNGIGTWKIDGNNLVIDMPNYPEVTYDLKTMQQEKSNGSLVIGTWEKVYGDGGYGPGWGRAGYFIGDNVKTLSKFSNTNFNELAKELPK